MNSLSRFSLICDELVAAIRQRQKRRAYELVERLRAIIRESQRA